MIVITTFLRKSDYFLIILKIPKTIEKSRMRTTGTKHESKVLVKNSDSLTKARFVSSMKQSKERIVSVEDPIAYAGASASVNDLGKAMLNETEAVSIWK